MPTCDTLLGKPGTVPYVYVVLGKGFGHATKGEIGSFSVFTTETQQSGYRRHSRTHGTALLTTQVAQDIDYLKKKSHKLLDLPYTISQFSGHVTFHVLPSMFLMFLPRYSTCDLIGLEPRTSLPHFTRREQACEVGANPNMD